MFLFFNLQREPLTDCLRDVDLIPPFNRTLLEVTFGKLYSWAVQNVRNILLDANSRFKELGESFQVFTLCFDLLKLIGVTCMNLYGSNLNFEV